MVLDTDSVVAAMRSASGASAAVVRAVRQRKATLLAIIPLAIEYEAVCRKSEQRLAAGLSDRQVDIFPDAPIAMAEPVETHFLWRPQPRDPNDEMVLEAAVNGRADALVTFNLRDFGTAPAQFGVGSCSRERRSGGSKDERDSNLPLRLPLSLKEAVERLSRDDRTSINQFVATAVAEKVSALQTAKYFTDRRARADFKAFDKIMRRRGGSTPREGDDLPRRKRS